MESAVAAAMQRLAFCNASSSSEYFVYREREREREERYQTPSTTTMMMSCLVSPPCVSLLSSLFPSSSSPSLDFRPQSPPLSSVGAQSRATTEIRLAIIVDDKVEQCRTPRVTKSERTEEKGDKIPSRDKVAT